jgi:hypothetical protein
VSLSSLGLGSCGGFDCRFLERRSGACFSSIDTPGMACAYSASLAFSYMTMALLRLSCAWC